jgi:hypothetical protein
MKIHSPGMTKVSQPSLCREDLRDDESDGGTSALGMDASLVTSQRDPVTLLAAVANLSDSLWSTFPERFCDGYGPLRGHWPNVGSCAFVTERQRRHSGQGAT